MAPSEAWGEPNTYTPGDPRDFERLYRLTYRRVVEMLIAVVGERAEAEDCAQEAFVRAFRAWPRWKPVAPAEAWVQRIAFRVGISHRRWSRLRATGEVLRRFGPPRDGDAADDVVVARDAMLDALRSLPPAQAAAIVLRHHHGFTNRDIATALGIPESTVASRLALAKRRLSELLGPGPSEAMPEAVATPGLPGVGTGGGLS